jgi:hypothetical protein
MSGYIGARAPGVSSGTENKKKFSITGTTTSLTGLIYNTGRVHVFHNGVRLVDGTDYTATDGATITLTTAAESGDEVVVISQASLQIADVLTLAGGDLTGDLSVDGIISTTNGADIDMDGTASGQLKLDGNGYGGAIALNAQGMNIYTNSASRDIIFGTNETEVMRIDGTGIDVTGEISIDNTTGSPNQTLLLLQADLGTNDRNMQIKSPATDSASAPFRFATGNSFAFEIDSTTDALVIDASANVGIGTDSPDTLLELVGANPILTIRDTDTGISTNDARLRLAESGASSSLDNYFDLGFVAGKFTIGSNAVADALTINRDTGNLLVGTTSAYGTTGTTINQAGLIYSSADGDRAGQFDRTTSDGELVRFSKAGTTVGNIGVVSGNDLFIVNQTKGLRFQADAGFIQPCNSTGSDLDNTLDLGQSNSRFKDAYLSGGVYLGGTGSANKLEDYEEGTWTPVIYGTSAAGTWSPTGNNGGGYVKIGNQVTCWLNAVGTLSGASGEVRISGLPFPNAAVTSVRRNAVYSTGSIQYWAGISARVIAPLIEPGQTTMYFHTYGTNDTQGGQPAVTNTSHNHHSFVTYMVE